MLKARMKPTSYDGNNIPFVTAKVHQIAFGLFL